MLASQAQGVIDEIYLHVTNSTRLIPKGPKIEDQAAADAVPRNVTIGFYGPLSIREGTDPAWIEAAEQAYRSDEAAARQQQAIPLADGEDYGDEFADEEVPF